MSVLTPVKNTFQRSEPIDNIYTTLGFGYNGEYRNWIPGAWPCIKDNPLHWALLQGLKAVHTDLNVQVQMQS